MYLYYVKQIAHLISTLTIHVIIIYTNLLYKNLILHNLLNYFFMQNEADYYYLDCSIIEY